MTTQSTQSNTISHQLTGRVKPAWFSTWVCLFMLLLCAGCQTPFGLDVSKLRNDSPEETVAQLKDQPEKKSFLNRLWSWNKKDEAPRYRKAAPPEAVAKYKEAEKLFEKKEYAAAEKMFKKLVKKYNDTSIEEDALFMIAESQFARKRYSWAQDSYDALFQEFPSSRYTDQSTQRLFTIAKTWLDFPDVVTSNELQQVNFENPKSTPPVKKGNKKYLDPTRTVPILPNFHNRSRPVFDTNGRALQALKSIWLNDPTGPLADDALMMSASHHLRNKDYLEADRVYKILREEYPKSQHLENAFVLGSHVKLMSYQGDHYDRKGLEEAEKLKKSTLSIFPKTASRERLRDELRKIEEAKAQHEWQNVLYWQKKRKPKAVVIYCQVVIEEYPHSTYADLAREKLKTLQSQPQQSGWTLPKLRPIQFPNLRPVPKQSDEEPKSEKSVGEETTPTTEKVPAGRAKL